MQQPSQLNRTIKRFTIASEKTESSKPFVDFLESLSLSSDIHSVCLDYGEISAGIGFLAYCSWSSASGQVVYRMYIDFGCPNFNCHFKPNVTSNKTLHGVVATGNAVFTIVSFAAVISYILFNGSFFTASRLDSALVCPSETLMTDINKSDAWLLFLAYVLIIVSFLGLGASLYTLPKTSEIRDPHYTVAVITGTGAQLLVHLASINTCQVFAVSSLAIGMLFFVIHNINI